MIFFSAIDSNDVFILLLVGILLQVVINDFFAFTFVVLGSRSGGDVVIGLLFFLAKGLLYICLLVDGITGSGLATFSRRLCYTAGDTANPLR